jgi:glycosyltransferase involved in cell wall biosynthesis
MKVLHFSAHDILGGAARAAFRIHKSLETKVDSIMAVNNKLSDEYNVIAPASVSQRFLVKILTQLNYQPAKYLSQNNDLMFSNGLLYTPSQQKTLREVNPDIVNLHWINEGLISINKIRRIDRPTVWTVHDMWPITGGCHYTVGCEAYQSKCGKCPQLKSKRAYDLSTFVFNHKKKLGNKITFVAPSLWMKNCIEKSALFGESQVHQIPYPINLKIYKPRSKNFLRELLGLPLDKKLIVFGAMNALGEERKGFKYLLSAIQHLADLENFRKNTELVVFGSSRPQGELNKIFTTHYLGKLSDELSISLAYSACDAFIAPSTQDNLPNTVIESLACGVPVVAFNIGGMPDMITTGYNGYLAEPFSSVDLAKGIIEVLQNAEVLAQNSRQQAVEKFSPDKVSEQYVKLYSSLI